MGSDTGGSVRVPAALCGVLRIQAVARRPQHGRGVPPQRLAGPLGLLARSVPDLALGFRTVTGSAPRPGRRHSSVSRPGTSWTTWTRRSRGSSGRCRRAEGERRVRREGGPRTRPTTADLPGREPRSSSSRRRRGSTNLSCGRPRPGRRCTRTCLH